MSVKVWNEKGELQVEASVPGVEDKLDLQRMESKDLLVRILIELVRMNVQLEMITDTQVKDSDLDL